MIRLLLASTAALAVLFTTHAASADSRRAAADIRAVIPGASLAASTLVGRSGQLYLPHDGGWKREGRGGVACDIRGAFRLSGKLWAACSWAPLFSRAKGIWSARPLPNRGRSRVVWDGNRVVVSVGRHIYTWGGGWKRRSSAPGRIKSLHAESARRLVAVTTRRQLVRSAGTNWSVVLDAPRRRDKTADPPQRVFGSSKRTYAITEKGVIAAVGRSGISPLRLPARVSSLDVGVTIALSDGDVLAAATITRGSQSSTGLVRFRGTRIELEPGPTLGIGERIGLLYAIGPDLLLATHRGRVFIRDASGSWSPRAIVNELSPDGAATANGGPAPSR